MNFNTCSSQNAVQTAQTSGARQQLQTNPSQSGEGGPHQTNHSQVDQSTQVSNPRSTLSWLSSLSSSFSLSSLSSLSSRWSVEEKQFINPAGRTAQDDFVRGLALGQTLAARNLLYHPGAALRQEMGKAASALVGILVQLTDSELKRIGNRDFSPGGLLSGKSSAALRETLERLTQDASSEESRASATDRCVLVVLMTNIAAFYRDAHKFTKLSTSILSDRSLRNRLSKIIKEAGLSPLSDDVVKRVSKSLAVRGEVEVKKRAERKRSDAASPIVGIHNLGIEADEKLGIPKAERIPTLNYPLWHIDAARVSDTTEPLVAHMSGCPGEVLMVWDMLCGQNAEDIYTGVLDPHPSASEANLNRVQPMEHLTKQEKEARLARAAGACAMLIGIGHHSAVEVISDALTYTGQDIRRVLNRIQDAADLFGESAATDLISELFETQTKPRGSSQNS